MSNKKKRIYGLIGYPVKHSLSPAMHNEAFKARGINAEYRLFEIKPDELEDFLSRDIQVRDINGDSFNSQDIVGFNVTIPHKVPILVKDITTTQDRFVVLTGAVNTVKRERSKLKYYNTDVKGFIKSLQDDLKFDTNDKNVLIFGCGGVSRAIIAGLSEDGIDIRKIYLYDLDKKAVESTERHFSQFDSVKNKLEPILFKQIPDKIKDVHLLINASPVGMKEGDSSLIDKEVLRICKGNLSVYDVVYNRETQLVKDAKELGISAVGGLGMLLYQGMLSFGIWTGKPAPKDVMEKALSDGIRALN